MARVDEASSAQAAYLPFDERPFGLHFAFGVIELMVRLVKQAASSMRGSSAVLRIFHGLVPGVRRVPCANTAQMWLLRLGLYEITRSKEQADDWVWIMDHTIQIGTTKCLLVVGCRGQQWQADRRPLEHHDLQVLALEPVTESNGEIVAQQLKQLASETSPPRQIVSDRGSDLQAGIESFCATHPETCWAHDIAHEAALVLKRELQADERWSAYVSDMGRAKSKLQQTTLAHLTPPSPKSKARYMNLESLVTWGTTTLAYLDAAEKVEEPAVSPEVFEEKLGWLREYQAALQEWDGVMEVVSKTLTYVRKQGYHRKAKRELAVELPEASDATLRGRVSKALLEVVARESKKAKRGERLIGSSECIESLIGTGKRLEGQQSKSGFTKMVLGIAAMVVKPTKLYLHKALTHTKVKDVYAWCQKNLGTSVQALRRQALGQPRRGTETG